MYDLSRAYGLSYILNILSGKEVHVSDMGYYYLIDAAEIDTDLSNIIGKLAILVGDDLPWSSVLSTLGRADRKKKTEEIKSKLQDEKFIRNGNSSIF